MDAGRHILDSAIDGSELLGEAAGAAARILVVDDDINNLKAIRGILEGLADEIIFANSGREALRHILRLDFALILMDVFMPDLDGYETAAMIRHRKRSSRIPIIFLTAADRDDVQMFKGYSAGAVDFVFKPIEPFFLRSKVSVFVDLHRKTQEVLQKAEHEKRLLIENARANDEKLRIERELRRSEERQALIMRSLPIAFYTAEENDGVAVRKFFGNGIATISGWPASHFNADPAAWTDRIHPEDRDRVFSAFARIATAGTAAVDYRVLCANGVYRTFLDQAVLTNAEDGHPREIVGSLLDITERLSVQEQLMQAQKMDAVGRLTGGIAHDFNNMLTVVVGSLDRLRRRIRDNPDALKAADMALQGALRCAELTGRLLAFSRKQPLVRKIVDLNEIVFSIEAMLRRLIGDHIQLEFRCSPDIWMTETDPAQIESAIINLAINARDAMPKGGRLVIGTSNFREADRETGASLGDFVVVTVSDTGYGIAPEVLNRIFEPFFTTKSAGHGTGLGLSIIYNYIRQMGGNIEVDSEVGQGTTVRLMLPRSDPAGSVSEQPKRDEQFPRGNGELILIVEDDEIVRHQTVLALCDLGYSVLEAENGHVALEILEHRKDVKLLFTDIAMPGAMNGFELAGRARMLNADLRVLFASGNPEFASGRRLTLPSERFLVRKPYRDHELARAVRDVFALPPAMLLESATAEAALNEHQSLLQ